MSELVNKKILWAWLLKTGYMNARPSYYGGIEFVNKDCLGVSTQGVRAFSEYKPKLIDAIKVIGIDWDKTRDPELDYSYEFDGTDADSRRVQIVTGKIFLPNGIDIECYAKDDIDEYHAVYKHLKGKNIVGVIGDACRAARGLIDFE